MKITTKISGICLLIFSLGLISKTNAQQDTIVKTDGTKIPCKILEVGANGISYKRVDITDGPLYVVGKEEIVYVRLRNGDKQTFPTTNPQPKTGLDKNPNSEGAFNQPNETQRGKKDLGPISSEHKIMYDGKKYYVNGRRIGSRDADRLLSRSTNPAVLIPYKTARLTKTFQKIVKITSYPSTIAGGAASISTFRTVYIEAQNGGAGISSWVNAGLSFVGTLAFPITAKILKKRQTKLYDKTIDLYNMDKI
jgi:hypothetical protein